VDRNGKFEHVFAIYNEDIGVSNAWRNFIKGHSVYTWADAFAALEKHYRAFVLDKEYIVFHREADMVCFLLKYG